MKKYAINEKIKQINLFDERWYQVGDKDLPSVTTYLESYPKGFGFDKWLRETKDPLAVRDEAAQLGTYVHRLIELTLKGETVEFEEGKITEWERYLSWCLWWKDFNNNDLQIEIVPEFIEFITYDLDHEYAGTVDFIPRFKEKDAISWKYLPIDWKTGSFLGDVADIQVAAYQRALVKQFPNYEFCNPLIVQLNPNLNKKGFRSHEVKDVADKFEDFLHTQHIWKRVNKNPKPKYRTYPTEVNLDFIQNNSIIGG